MKRFKKTKEVLKVKDNAPKGFDEKPEGDPCPKCGQTHAGWIGPTYEPPQKMVVVDRSHPSKVKRTVHEVAERLAWACHVCGFKRYAPTKDTREA